MQKMKEKLARNELVRIIGVGRLMHHNFVQILGIQGGFDGIWFDHEHVGFSTESLEIAALAAFLLSDEAEFITGQIIEIDGGFKFVG